MKIALIAPSGVPFAVGGAEKLWWGLLHHTNQLTDHQMELIKLPAPERTFAELIASYRRFSELDLGHFDRVISTKYPAWMASHPDHHLYLQHTLRGLYDTYPWPARAGACPFTPEAWPSVRAGRAIKALRHHPDMRRLRRLLAARPERAQLPALFACIERLLNSKSLPRALADRLFAFPGPLSRAVIHHLDAIATAPGAIARYSAISRNVTRRADYFPRGASIKVIHHPSDLVLASAAPEGNSEGQGEKNKPYLFTVSRLDAPKRIDLLVRAFLRTTVDAELRIAGIGPLQAELEALAADDPRVRLLGFKRDRDIAALYQQALAVPFLPFDEDYGLITIEAMQAGKPVITTRDAGGVNEFVRNAETGWCVDPEEDALARAITQAVEQPKRTRQLGESTREAVAHVTWPDTVRELVTHPEPSARAAFPSVAGIGQGEHWLVLNSFVVYPPMGGGQNRMYHLYRHAARQFNATITLLVLAPESSSEQRLEIAPGLFEHRIPMTRAQAEHAAELNRALGVPVDDIAAIEGFRRNPRFLDVLKGYAEHMTLGICAHPYLVHAMHEYARAPWWYEAHNVEVALKRSILAHADDRAAARVEQALEQVEQAERLACTQSHEILACAEEDLAQFRAAYALPAGKGQVVPNCADLPALPYIDAAARRAWQQRLYQSAPTALFLGSWHGPNLEAADFICHTLAPACPQVVFLLAGSLCDHPSYKTLPPNVRALGRVSDAELKVLLASVSVALNPMFSGSGSNLKMLDYTASGVPVLSTPFGNRGLGFSAAEVWLAEKETFGAALKSVLDMNDAGRELRTAAARELTAQRFDWSVAAEALINCHR